MHARLRLLFACTIVLIALALRLVSITRVGLWIDEASSVAIARLPISDLVIASSNDPHPPAYYLMLHGWIQLMGNSEFAVRLLTVFAGVLTVAVTYRLAGELLMPLAGLPTAWIMAFSPVLIEYSQETRMYSVLGLWCVVLVTLALQIDKLTRADPLRRKLAIYLAYVVVGAIGLYTHYFFAFLLLALSLRALIRGLVRRDWPGLLSWLAAQVLVGVLFLPWVPVTLYQMQNYLFTWLVPPTWVDLLHTLTYLSVGRPNPSISDAVVILSMLVAAWCLTTYRFFRKRKLVEVIFLASWLFLPPIADFVVSQRRPVYLDRQFLFVIPALVLFSIGGLVQRWQWASILVVGFTLVCLVPLSNLYFVSQKQGWRELVQYIQSQADPNDVIYLNPLAGRVAIDYYLTAPLPIEGYPPSFDLRLGGFPGKQTTPGIINKQFSTLQAKYRDIWLIQFTAAYWDPNKNITNWLEQHAVRESLPAFYGLDVRRYRFAP